MEAITKKVTQVKGDTFSVRTEHFGHAVRHLHHGTEIHIATDESLQDLIDVLLLYQEAHSKEHKLTNKVIKLI